MFRPPMNISIASGKPIIDIMVGLARPRSDIPIVPDNVGLKFRPKNPPPPPNNRPSAL